MDYYPVIIFVIVLIPDINGQGSSVQAPCDSSFGCISQIECPTDEYWTPAAATYGCCPSCMKGKGLHDTGCDAANPCAPGLVCWKEGICQLNTENCLATQHVPPKVSWTPVCDSTGNFLPKQCRGDRLLGRCFCYSATGKRIFGWDWRGKADEMNCACSRHRSDLEATGREDVTLHCTANGSFEELQCDDGLCWCADPKTGEPRRKMPVVLPSMWKKLPCYNHTLHGEQYLRQCESAAFAQTRARSKFTTHGHGLVTHTNIMCDYDGSYGRFDIEFGNAYCLWRDGERILPFQTSTLKLNAMTCNCARDQKHYQAAGLKLGLLCDGNGNYAMMQDRNGKLFCVDRDGFEVSGGDDVTADTNCKEYMFV